MVQKQQQNWNQTFAIWLLTLIGILILLVLASTLTARIAYGGIIFLAIIASLFAGLWLVVYKIRTIPLHWRIYLTLIGVGLFVLFLRQLASAFPLTPGQSDVLFYVLLVGIPACVAGAYSGRHYYQNKQKQQQAAPLEQAQQRGTEQVDFPVQQTPLPQTPRSSVEQLDFPIQQTPFTPLPQTSQAGLSQPSSPGQISELAPFNYADQTSLSGMEQLDFLAQLQQDVPGQQDILIPETPRPAIEELDFLVQTTKREPVRQLSPAEELLAYAPTEFEARIRKLLEAEGYRKIQTVGKANSLIMNLSAIDPQANQTIIQCRRYTANREVSLADLQRFIGLMFVDHMADKGIFMTTSSFTQAAIELVQKQPIQLIDGISLYERLREIASEAPDM
jgi:hypothetical protein